MHNIVHVHRAQYRTCAPCTISYMCTVHNIVHVHRAQYRTCAPCTISYMCAVHNIVHVRRAQYRTCAPCTISYMCTVHNYHSQSYMCTIINPRHMCKGYSYSTHFVCVCVTTLEATLIYGAKNRHQWTANSTLFIPNLANWLIRFRNSCLNSLHCTVLTMATPTKVQS